MRFKFVTLNVWHGGKLWNQVIDFLRQENPDILTIQEAYNGTNPSFPKNYRTLEEFKAALNFKDIFFSPEVIHLTKYGEIETGNAILSKFPITFTNTLYFDKPFIRESVEDLDKDPTAHPRNLQSTQIDIQGIILNVFNLHGIWGENGRDNPRRLTMSQKILKQVKGKEKIILSGDFNVDQETKSIKDIDAELINIFKDELKTSFNIKRKPKESGYSDSVVDNIFTTNDIKVLEHFCPNVDISDHLPLVATFEI